MPTLRWLTFFVTVYFMFKLSYITSPLISWFATFNGMIIVAWYLSGFIKRKLILRQLGPLSPKGKAVFITGCDTGFGHRLAIKLNSIGYHVFAACLFPNGSDAQSLLDKVKNRSKLDLVKVDVTNPDDLIEARDYVRKVMSENELQLHALVNNAGVLQQNLITLEIDPTIKDYEFQMNVNFYGVLRTTRTFMADVVKANGRFVNLTSMAGRDSVMGSSAYCASKHAAVAFTKTLASEIHQISSSMHVVSVEPWFYNTNLISVKPLLSVVDKQWATASDELRKLHEKSDIIRKIRNATKFFFTSPISIDPDVNEVVEALTEAVTSREPHPVYRVSRWQKVIPLKLLIEVIPVEWAEAIVNLIYHLLMNYTSDYKNESIDLKNNNAKLIE